MFYLSSVGLQECFYVFEDSSVKEISSESPEITAKESKLRWELENLENLAAKKS